MEVVPIKFYRGINSYWKKRRYQKLDDSSSSPPPPPGKRSRKAAARLGSGRRRPGGGWFLRLRRRLSFRLRLRLPSPAKLIARIRDAYIDCMLAMAGKAQGIGAGPQMWSRRVPQGRPGKVSSSEVERRLMFEIYRSLVLAGEIKVN